MTNKNKFVRLLILSIISFLAVIQVVILNQYSTRGEVLTQKNQEIDQVKKENKRLDQKIASSSSYTYIFERAKQLGLSQSPTPVSLTAPVKYASILGTAL